MKKVNLYDIENYLEGVDRNGRSYDMDAVKVAFGKFVEENGDSKFDITHMSNLLERSKVPNCSFDIIHKYKMFESGKFQNYSFGSNVKV